MKMKRVEYYRCWNGSEGDSGFWDTDHIIIPANTPDDTSSLNEAIVKAAKKVKWRGVGVHPAFVGFYCHCQEEEK